MVHASTHTEWLKIHGYFLQLEREGRITRTFRRLDPERQQEIVLAILSEAAENGPTLVNIKQVAQRSGVAVGSLYTYFGNREGMLDFAIELVTRFMMDEMESYRPILVSLPIREGLKAYLAGGIEWSRLFSGVIQLFARGAYQGDPELQERMVVPIARLLREIVREMLDGGITRGEIREDIDLETASRIVHALTIAVGDSQLLPFLNTYFQVSGDMVPPEKAIEGMIDLVLAGLGAAGVAK